MRRLGLRRDRDIGAVARGAQRHRKANTARGAGDEERLALEGHGGLRSFAALSIDEATVVTLMVHLISLSCPAKAGHPVTPVRWGLLDRPVKPGDDTF